MLPGRCYGVKNDHKQNRYIEILTHEQANLILE